MDGHSKGELFKNLQQVFYKMEGDAIRDAIRDDFLIYAGDRHDLGFCH